jgi:hypothetical protein
MLHACNLSCQEVEAEDHKFHGQFELHRFLFFKKTKKSNQIHQSAG